MVLGYGTGRYRDPVILPGNKQFETQDGRNIKSLISEISPLSSLVYLQFWQAQLASDFENWGRAGLDKFCNLGDESGMFSFYFSSIF